MNYFIEGLQGSGKSTLVKRMSDKHPEADANGWKKFVAERLLV